MNCESVVKKALITGIAGQDGSCLAELLLAKGYEVHGIVRRIAIEDTDHKLKNLRNILDQINLHVASLDNVLSMIKIVKGLQPDECYHLAASNFVSYTFEDEISILNNNVNSTYYLLAAIRKSVFLAIFISDFDFRRSRRSAVISATLMPV